MRIPVTPVVHQLLLLALLFVASSTGAHTPRQQLDEIAAAEFSGNPTGGTVIVRQAGRDLLHTAYGFANLEKREAMRTDHLLATGSITKQFTAAAILLLLQEGKLNLDDQARQYIPGLQPEGAFTIEQLLTHTSGFPNVVDRPDFEALLGVDHTTRELLALTSDRDLLFAPGSGYHYSDSGYFLLGAIIEEVSGIPYAEFMEQKVFRPNGLNHTRYGSASDGEINTATGYTRKGNGFAPARNFSITVPYAAGAIYSTASDLADWVDRLKSGKVIERQWINKAWSPARLSNGKAIPYGYGWNLCQVAGYGSLDHGGFIYGFTANLLHLPEPDLTVAVLVNQDSGEPEASYLALKLARTVLTGSPELPTKRLSDTERDALLGAYRYTDGGVRRIFEKDGLFFSQLNNNDPVTLVPLATDFLAFPDTEGTYGLKFNLAKDGKAREVVTTLKCVPQASAIRTE